MQKITYLVARMEPTADQFDSKPLKDILQRLNHTSQLLENWITCTSHINTGAKHKGELIPMFGNHNPNSQTEPQN